MKLHRHVKPQHIDSDMDRHMIPRNKHVCYFPTITTSLVFFFCFISIPLSVATIRINEVADKGSTGVCSGNDWIELYLPLSEDSLNLTDYVIHDDKGPDDEDAFTFEPTVINPGEHLLICTRLTDSPQFGIGSDDTVTLLAPDGSVMSSVGPLPGPSLEDVTYAWDESQNEYTYTSTPTPGAENVITSVLSKKERLAAQNELGTKFFNMDKSGFPVPDGFDDIVDLRMNMDPDEFLTMMEDQSYEVYSPFLNATITARGDPENTMLDLSSPGRLRPRGQSTLALGTCFNFSAIPFVIDWDSTDKTQTLYGLERAYLRNHIFDGSYLREWSAYRMLARFNLPHLRTRSVRFYINDEFMGLYDLMEAVDQEYVFHRSFPDYDPSDFALYKMKTMAIGCGYYSKSQLEKARLRIDETSTPPYAFERGDHREKLAVYGSPAEDPQNFLFCFEEFSSNIFREMDDAVLAYVRSGEDCGKMLVKEGLVDRDLGVKSWDDVMETFVNEHLSNSTCDEGCANSDLATEVDIENFLKNFAVYSVLLNPDSPMGNGNNYFLAQSGDGKGWKIVQYDLDNTATFLAGTLCDASCSEKLIHWSIARPTCRSLETNQIVGPLLSDPDLYKKYIEHVRTFATTIVTNTSFLEEIKNHAIAIQEDVKQDPWSNGGFLYPYELSMNGDDWYIDLNGTQISPFLPFLVARGEDVMKQLSALDNETFPRGHHLSEKVHPSETCVDWQVESFESRCVDACYYEGCYDASFFGTISFCDEDEGICYRGTYDTKCGGIPNGEQYENMTKFDGSERESWCVTVDFPLKVEQCPDPEFKEDEFEKKTNDEDDVETTTLQSRGRNSASKTALTFGVFVTSWIMMASVMW